MCPRGINKVLLSHMCLTELDVQVFSFHSIVNFPLGWSSDPLRRYHWAHLTILTDDPHPSD